MKLTDALDKLHPIVPMSPFIGNILNEFKLSDLKEIKNNKIVKALKEAEKAYKNAHQRTENTTSDYSYWSALGTETVWETVVNLLRSAQKVGADNLPDIPFPDLKDKVVMDAQWYMMKWGAEVAKASGAEPVKESD